MMLQTKPLQTLRERVRFLFQMQGESMFAYFRTHPKPLIAMLAHKGPLLEMHDTGVLFEVIFCSEASSAVHTYVVTFFQVNMRAQVFLLPEAAVAVRTYVRALVQMHSAMMLGESMVTVEHHVTQFAWEGADLVR